MAIARELIKNEAILKQDPFNGHNIVNIIESKNTKYELIKTNKGYHVKSSGRLKYERTIPYCQASILTPATFFCKTWYILRGSFALNEEGEEYFFSPSERGWSIKYRGGEFMLNEPKIISSIVEGELTIKGLLKTKSKGKGKISTKANEEHAEQKLKEKARKVELPSNIANRIVLFLSKNERNCLAQLLVKGEMDSSQVIIHGGNLFLKHLIDEGIIINKIHRVGKWYHKLWELNLKSGELDILSRLLEKNEISYSESVLQCGEEFISRLYAARLINFCEEDDLLKPEEILEKAPVTA